MFFCRLKNFITMLMALVLAFAVLSVIQLGQVSRFSALDGKRTFYLYSASSQAIIKEEITPLELCFVKGECVTLAYTDREQTLQEILRLYRAEILFEEEVGGTHSYYCKTQNWVQGTRINGVVINLHIAFNKETCAVGAPLIFGGF